MRRDSQPRLALPEAAPGDLRYATSEVVRATTVVLPDRAESDEKAFGLLDPVILADARSGRVGY